MTRALPERLTRALTRRGVLVALAAAPAALLALGWWTPVDWLPRVIGRLHPLVVHFPVALVLAAGVAELWRVVGPRLVGRHVASRPPLGLLFAGAASAVTAAALGVLLQRGEEVEGQLVRWHLIAGVTVAVGALIALAAAPRAAAAGGRRAAGYQFALLLTCGAVGVTGHLGGSLTHGEEYLTELLPNAEGGDATVATLAFPSPDSLPPAQWEAYEHGVRPILQARCGSCHNERNSKGRLVLTGWEGMAAGGKSGPAVAAGDVERSRLVQRILLPAEEKEHMPPRRKPQPTPDELAFLTRWVEAGAPREGTLASLGADEEWLGLAARLPASARPEPAVAAADDEAPREIDEAAVARARAPLAAAVVALQRRFPGAVGYESRGSADLHVNAALFGRRFGDAELVALAPVAARVVSLDLTGTAVTDRSAAQLARMAALRTLRLGDTAVGDPTVAALVGMRSLASLSLYRTAVTPAAAAQLARLPALERLYAAGTGLTAARP